MLDGKSVITCSRTQPPFRSRVFESEKLHLMFGTTPLSVLCAPRLSGFCRSSSLFVPPKITSLSEPTFVCTQHNTQSIIQKGHEPRIGAPFPFLSMGSP